MLIRQSQFLDLEVELIRLEDQSESVPLDLEVVGRAYRLPRPPYFFVLVEVLPQALSVVAEDIVIGTFK